MIKEIYIRTIDDPNFENGVIDYNNSVESLVSQIRVLLATNKHDVMGEPDMGVDLEFAVFNTVKNSISIREDIMEQIRRYVYIPDDLSVDVKVEFGKDEMGSDFGLVDIIVNGIKRMGLLVDRN